MNYWTFKHKPGPKGGKSAMDYVEWARNLQAAIMHYEYGPPDKGNDPSKVTLNWSRLLKIRKGDVIFLRGDTHIHAYGTAIEPRKNPDKKVSARDIINANDSEYTSRNYEGCIHFTEKDVVFYQDFTPDKEWGGKRRMGSANRCR